MESVIVNYVCALRLYHTAAMNQMIILHDIKTWQLLGFIVYTDFRLMLTNKILSHQAILL